MQRFFVIGNPVEHSRSPEIHAAFARQTGAELTYERRLFAPGRFAEELARLVEQEHPAGCNVTVPFKLDAAAACGALTARAARAGAVNTLVFGAGGITGDNTDGAGFVADVERRRGARLAGARLLILGAGGAARGLLAGLEALPRGCAEIVVANRTAARAEALAADFAGLGARGCGFAQLPGGPFDIIVNATASSMGGQAPAVPGGVYAGAGLAYDLFYAAQPTAFMRAALLCGAKRACDGLGMLVEQAAESFEAWLG
ncbi:MAG: shikimate dehydrogenase, partial [Duodenibacillus sp.]|nr:shikimate dehydrogenase [Duodenibacillus sp.]